MSTLANWQVRNEAMRIGGERVETPDRIEVRYPFTNEVVGTVPAGTTEHARQAIEIAAGYRAQLSRYERQQILLRTSDFIWKRREAISELITLELGISRRDSLYECGRARDVFALAGHLCIVDEGRNYAGDITENGQERRIFTRRDPLRAIAAITPFNHPLNMVAHKLAPAIATNNCVVLKPTEKTPLTALLLADLLYEAGLPPQMLSVVTGWPQDIGDELVTNPDVELITFTGGIKVGKAIAAKAGYKRAVLELGGNDPLIVLDDLDDKGLERAAGLAVSGATRNSGQRCTAVKRILVAEPVADRFVELVVARAKAIRFGDPMATETELGTVIDEASAAEFERRVVAAADAGGRILYHPRREGALLPPIVIDNVPTQSQLVREETFGPVIPILRCADIDDIIATSNSTDFALSSGVCSNRMDHIGRLVDELVVGTVNVWEVPGYRTEMSPFGGIKDSGNGCKEGMVSAMTAYTNVKTFSLPWSSGA
jgi:putative phosphonoacetaldehyde dehydrogenase